MTKQNSGAAGSIHTLTCRRCGATFRSHLSAQDEKNYCPTCFAGNIREVERWVLEDYVKFGARARSTSAAIFLDTFRKTDDARVRKFVALKVFEEFILATEDQALGAIGAWSDLDWDEMEQALDRIRHENKPTPPITDL